VDATALCAGFFGCLLMVGVAESWKRFAGGPGVREPGRGEALFELVGLTGTITFSRRMAGFFAPPKKLFIIAARRLQAFNGCRCRWWKKEGKQNVVSV
jgi:hypothetical protein